LKKNLEIEKVYTSNKSTSEYISQKFKKSFFISLGKT
jgi:hypothetical protein